MYRTNWKSVLAQLSPRGGGLLKKKKKDKQHAEEAEEQGRAVKAAAMPPPPLQQQHLQQVPHQQQLSRDDALLCHYGQLESAVSAAAVDRTAATKHLEVACTQSQAVCAGLER